VIVLAAVASATLAVDGVSKALVTTRLAEGRLYALAPGWGLRRIDNRRSTLSVAHTVALLAVILVVIVAVSPQAPTAAGLGIAIGGAAGNVVDRVRRGAVVDFVAAGPWPVFNLADAAMAIGLSLAAVSLL
jgi:signal peptidase II